MGTRKNKLIACALAGLVGPAHAYLRPQFLPSFESQARAGTGLTSPLLPILPEPARLNLSEQSFLSDNVALLGWLPGYDARISPFTLRARKSGSLYNPELGSQQPTLKTPADLAQALASDKGQLQNAELSVGLLNLRKEVGFATFYEDSHEARLDANGDLAYARYRDLKTQLGVGMPLLDDVKWGRLDFGVLVKLDLRRGDEISLAAENFASSTASLAESATAKKALAGGADFGLLYTLPWEPRDFRIQLAYVWRDTGSTQFFLGAKSSRGLRFEAFPNSQNLGVGVGTPLLLRAFRAGIRVEGLGINEDFKTLDKIAASVELRFIEALTLYGGLRGTSPAFGAEFRVPYLEILVGSTPIYSARSEDFRAFRTWNFTLKTLF